MNAVWILIVVYTSYAGFMQTVEFNTKASCEQAAKDVKNTSTAGGQLQAFCYEK